MMGTAFIKSSFCSTDGCVEVGVWGKSSFSQANGNCAEVQGTEDGGVLLRDSKNPDSAVLSFNAEEWNAFIAGVKAEEFDLA